MIQLEGRVPFGAEMTDMYVTIDIARMRRERAARAAAVMRDANVPAILVGGVQNVRYLTGFWWSDYQPQMSYCLSFAEHEPIVYAHAGSFQKMPIAQPWIGETRIGRSWLGGLPGEAATRQEATEWADDIVRELGGRGLLKEPLAVVDFDWIAREALLERGVTIVDGAPLMLAASKIKTIDELNCLKLTAAISTTGFETAARTIAPGVRQSDVERAMKSAMFNVGAEMARSTVYSGPLAFERGVSGGDRILEHGDTGYMLTCGTAVLGYTCCLYRSYILGRKPNSKEKGWYDALRDRLDAVMAAIKPGASTADVAQHFRPAETWGYGSEAEVLTVEWGHGVGLVSIGSSFTSYNLPAINRQWSMDHPQIIEPGMVIALEALEGEPGVGGARLENMVLVTDTGATLLDSYPRDNFIEIL